MGWTSPRTWVTSEVVTASVMNTHVRDNLNALNGFVRKTADESVTSSTTLQNDDHLSFTIGATGTYVVDVFMMVTSAANAAGDIKVGFTFPTISAGSIMASGLDAALASGNAGTAYAGAYPDGTLTSGSSALTFGASTTATAFNVHGVFVFSATGTLQVQWAQAASSASATTVLKNSHMRVWQAA